MRKLPGPFLSVLIATHNQAEYLTQCLDSLLDQTLERAAYQIVIVDDGSTDTTATIISGYTKHIDVLVTHAHRMGLVKACNSGLQRAQGPWIVRLDSDDWLAPDALEGLKKAAESGEGFDIIVPGHWVVEGGRVQVTQPDVGNVFTWIADSTLLRRQTVLDVGGYRDFYWEEYDLYLRKLCRGAKAQALPTPVLYYRKHEGGMTAQAAARDLGWRELVDAWPPSTLDQFGFHEELAIAYQQSRRVLGCQKPS